MFLSDRLTEIGRKSNKKSNLSMAESATQMQNEVLTAIKGGENPTRAMNAMKLACDTLTKEGFAFFKNVVLDKTI
jgi:hypothetical protein